MRTLVLCSVLLLLSTLNASSAFVASYQRTDGTIIDPIECWMADFSCTAAGDRDVHVYAGPNLEPLANLESAALALIRH